MLMSESDLFTADQLDSWPGPTVEAGPSRPFPRGLTEHVIWINRPINANLKNNN